MSQVQEIGETQVKPMMEALSRLFELVCPSEWFVDYVPNWFTDINADLYEYVCKSDKDYHVGVLVIRDLGIVAINPDDVVHVLREYRRKLIKLDEAVANMRYIW